MHLHGMAWVPSFLRPPPWSSWRIALLLMECRHNCPAEEARGCARTIVIVIGMAYLSSRPNLTHYSSTINNNSNSKKDENNNNNNSNNHTNTKTNSNTNTLLLLTPTLITNTRVMVPGGRRRRALLA